MSTEMTNDKLVDQIVRYETGDASDDEILELFAELIGSGTVWQLQGSYGRVAADLIRAELISADGVIDWDTVEERRC